VKKILGALKIAGLERLRINFKNQAEGALAKSGNFSRIWAISPGGFARKLSA